VAARWNVSKGMPLADRFDFDSNISQVLSTFVTDDNHRPISPTGSDSRGIEDQDCDNDPHKTSDTRTE